MTTHALHDGFRHAATTLTNQVLAVIAMALCTLLGYQLFESAQSTSFAERSSGSEKEW